jgi:O-acetylhomoserine/O-acetylserine sulfhydrylase-like pyridoxal-dependent enzyme
MGEPSDLPIDQVTQLAISQSAAPATLAVHADDVLNNVTDVAPPIHLSTTYRFAENPDDLITANERPV